MRKTRKHPQAYSGDDVRTEYRFDYSRGRPNRFAARVARPVVAIVLDSDVAAVFKSSSKVIVLARQYRSYCIIGGASPPFPLSRVDYWQ
jgi:hypothetical protein